MKKIIFSMFAVVFFSLNVVAQEEDDIRISKETLESFEINVKRISETVKAIKNDPMFKESPGQFEKQLKDAQVPLVEISKKMMEESKITVRDISEGSLESLTDEQTINTGLILYASQTNLEISSNSVGSCIANAVVGLELHNGFWSSFTNRRTMLRLLGRTITRALGPVAAALMVYDFADCMGWI